MKELPPQLPQLRVYRWNRRLEAFRPNRSDSVFLQFEVFRPIDCVESMLCGPEFRLPESRDREFDEPEWLPTFWALVPEFRLQSEDGPESRPISPGVPAASLLKVSETVFRLVPILRFVSSDPRRVFPGRPNGVSSFRARRHSSARSGLSLSAVSCRPHRVEEPVPS